MNIMLNKLEDYLKPLIKNNGLDYALVHIGSGKLTLSNIVKVEVVPNRYNFKNCDHAIILSSYDDDIILGLQNPVVINKREAFNGKSIKLNIIEILSANGIEIKLT